MIGRRVLLGGIAAAFASRASAQQPPKPLVGFLNSQSPARWRSQTVGFLNGLREGGLIEGDNVVVAYRWAEGDFDRIPALTAELAAMRPAVIAATGGSSVGVIVKSIVRTIPIVFISGADPVEIGLVESLRRPGGNATGFSLFTAMLGPKRLEFLKEIAPEVRLIGVLSNAGNPRSARIVAELHEAARPLGLALHAASASDRVGIAAAFDGLAAAGAGGVLVNTDPFLNAESATIAALAERWRLPVIYEAREGVAAGGLMSYGADFPDIYRRAGLYAARIVKGEKPADLPVQQPEKLEFVLNLKAARAIGLAIPPAVLARADEVIE